MAVYLPLCWLLTHLHLIRQQQLVQAALMMHRPLNLQHQTHSLSSRPGQHMHPLLAYQQTLLLPSSLLQHRRLHKQPADWPSPQHSFSSP